MEFVAVGVGAALGAWLRWALSLTLNAAQPNLPLGTLAANLIGGYLVGLAVAFFASHPQFSPAWRLFAITGFLGGLTTFSTFSAESMALLQQGQFSWALAHTVAHVSGALGACYAGYATGRMASG